MEAYGRRLSYRERDKSTYRNQWDKNRVALSAVALPPQHHLQYIQTQMDRYADADAYFQSTET